MTRHPAFVGLSREHHDGLLLAVRLQQGTRALERLWSHDEQWQAQNVEDFFAKHLAQHFRDEEEILFPEAASISPAGRGMVDELVADHEEMRRLAGSLTDKNVGPTRLGDPVRGPLAQKLKEFGEILERHIRREEREFFPFCESNMSGEKLDTLAAALNH
jgi:hemerythrin-like domain-containing protein